jgi:hypothetical protein
MKTLNKEEWLNEMPKLIYNLKLNYNFYFSGYYATIRKDILEIIKNPRNKHKIAIYNKDNRFFLVVYRKGSPDIYTCTEYKNDTKHNRINYFMRKFRKSYKKAEAKYEEKLYTNRVANAGRVQ